MIALAKKILIIGPSPDKSKGGMATVIDEIRGDKKLREIFDIDIHESYIDGNTIVRALFSVFSYIKFLFLQNKYDIYHIHAASRGSTFRKGYYVRAIKRWRKKVIFHIHGGEYMIFYNELSESKKKKMIEILKASDMVIALSREWKDRFEKIFMIDNCVVLENGIDTERLSYAVTEASKYQKSFVCLGKLGKEKGSYDLIEAIKIAREKVPDIKLYLAGDGEIRQVKERIKDENLESNIEVTGWIDVNKKIELLKHVSTVTLPSYNEGLPMSILEGMACGKAIISSTVGAIPEIVKEENGILIEPGDIVTLADALIRCATDLNMITAMGRANREKVNSEFSMKVMHERLAKFYSQI